MLFPPGATSVSIDIRIVDDSGLPVTGLLAATFPTTKYSLAGPNADATITLADLALITTAWASGGVKERGEGVYRLDLPDAALTTAGKVTIRGEASGKRVLCDVIEVDYAEVDVQQWKGATAPANTGDAFARLGAPAGVSIAADIAALAADLPTRITKNTALAGFMFKMVDENDGYTGETGLTVTATRSLDGAAFAACANSVTEVSNGWYKINLDAADLNANVVALRFTATGARPREITIVTQPT